jgi:hypothetical protein
MKRRRFPTYWLLISVLILWNCTLAESTTTPITFNNEQKISNGTARTVQPRIFRNSQGEMYLAWLESAGSQDVIYLRSSADHGLNWSPQLNQRAIRINNSWDSKVSTSSDFQICDDNNGYLYGVWVDLRNNSTQGDIYFNYSANHGQTWQSDDIHINTERGVSSPKIACDPQGNVYITWVNTAGRIYLNYSSDHGQTWQETDVRIDDSAGCLPPQIVCNDNRVYVAWIEQNNAGLYYRYSSDYGHNWQAKSTPPNSPSNPSYLQVMWGSQSSNPYFAWIQGGNKVYFWDVSKSASEQLPEGASSPFKDLRLAGDSQGNVYAVWLGANHVYETHRNVSTSTSWRTPGRRDTGYDSNPSSYPSVSCTSQGMTQGQCAVAVTWTQQRNTDLGMNAFVNYSLDSGANWHYSSDIDSRLYLKTSYTAYASSLEPQLCCGSGSGGEIYAIWVDNGTYGGVYFNSAINTDSTLEWAGGSGFSSDGVNPDSATGGSDFKFQVKYTNTQKTEPDTYQVWVDENDDGVYEPDEKYNMTPPTGSPDYSLGIIYTLTLPLRYCPSTDHIHSYRFYFMTNNNIALGSPAIDHSLTVTCPTTSLPVLRWAGMTGYTSDGVEPDAADLHTPREFRVKFTSYTYQNVKIEAWIDANDNSIYEESEKHFMKLQQGSSNPQPGETGVYTYTLQPLSIYPDDGKISYRFVASDSISFATGDPTFAEELVLNSNPVLCWADADGYYRPDPLENLFTFKVNYRDQDDDPPAVHQIWIDLNNDTEKQTEELYPIDPNDPNDVDYTSDILYTGDVFLLYEGKPADPNTTVPFQFDFRDNLNDPNNHSSSSECAEGLSPAGQSLIVYRDGNQPVLDWTADEGFKDKGVDVDPSPDEQGYTLTFQIKYIDYDGDQPGERGTLLDPGYEVWVDANDNGTYEPDERFLMDRDSYSHPGGGPYRGIYTRSIYHVMAPLDGELHYQFFFHDGKNRAIMRNEVAEGATAFVPLTVPFNLASLQSMDNPATVAINTIVTFQVKYTSPDNKLPSEQCLWLDIDDDGIPDGNEKLAMREADYSDADCRDGKEYKRDLMITYAGDGRLQYRFLFKHPGQDEYLGDPELGYPAANAFTIAVTLSSSYPLPTLTWTADYPKGINATKGHSGDTFTFQVRYHNPDPNTSCSLVRHQLWLDLNDDGEYGENEKIDPDNPNTDPNITKYGIYTFHKEVTLENEDGGVISYRFAFNNCYGAATGDPASDRTLTIDRLPTLKPWSVNPNPGDGGSTFTFQVTYTDEDNNPPSSGGFVWVDLNKDHSKQDIEQFPLKEKDPDEKSYKDGKVYQASTRMVFFDPNISTATSTSNNLSYQFFLSDANTPGYPDPNSMLIVNKAGHVPQLTYDGIIPPSSGNADDWVTFEVIYKDEDNDPPWACQVWVDEDGDGIYQSSEKYTMQPENVANKNYQTGVTYTQSVYLSGVTQTQVGYRFYFHDGKNLAEGVPTHDRSLALNHQPALESPKADPVQGGGGSSFTFQVTYRDLDNDPPQSAEIWVDENGNGIYEPNERYPMGQKGPGSEFTDGVCYEQSIKLHYAIDGQISTMFYFSDRPGSEDEIQGPKIRVTRYEHQPVLSWVNEAGYQKDGVNPDSSLTDAYFTFKVLYKDADNDAPEKIELWIDANSDSAHTSATRYTLSSSSSSSFTEGRVYSLTRMITLGSGDGIFTYWFLATDRNNSAAGAPTAGGKFYICNGTGGGGQTWYYRDKDGDGYGSASYPRLMSRCDTHTYGGFAYVDNSLDCNDNSANVHPGAPELHCDSLDNDCDPNTPDNFPPQLQFIPSQVVHVGQTITLCPQAYDEDEEDTVTFRYSGWTNKTTQVSSDTMRWVTVTDPNDVGTHWLTVTASDACPFITGDSQSSQKVMITVIGLGTIQGTVTNTVTYAPVANLSVQIQGMANDKYTVELHTGSFKISNLPPGEYRLIVSATNYQRKITPKIILCSGQTVNPQVQLLPNAAIVTGKVVEVKNGTEVSVRGIMVTATSMKMDIPPYTTTAQTDSSGNYSLYLPTGTFKLAAIDPNCLFKPAIETNNGNGFTVNTDPASSAHSLSVQTNSRLKLKMVRNTTLPYLPTLRVTSVEKWDQSNPDSPELITILYFYPQGSELPQLSLVRVTDITDTQDPGWDPNFYSTIGALGAPVYVDDGSRSGHYEAIYNGYYGYNTSVSCVSIQCKATYEGDVPKTFPYRFIIHPRLNDTLLPLLPISRSEISTTTAEGGHLFSVGYFDQGDDPNRVFDNSRVEIPPYGVYPVKTDASQDSLPLRVCLDRMANTLGDDVVSRVYNLQILGPLTTATSWDAATSWARLNPYNPVTVYLQVDMSRMFNDLDSSQTRYQDSNSSIVDDIEVRYQDADSSDFSEWKIDGIDNVRMDIQDQNDYSDEQKVLAQRYFTVACSLQHSGKLAVFQVTPDSVWTYNDGVTDTTVELYWPDRSLSEKGFEIWRKDPGDGDFHRVGKTSSNVSIFTDQGLQRLTTYQYKVRAIRSQTDPQRFSSFSDPLEVETKDLFKGTGGGSGGGGGGSCFISAVESAVCAVKSAVRSVIKSSCKSADKSAIESSDKPAGKPALMPGNSETEQVKWWAW